MLRDEQWKAKEKNYQFEGSNGWARICQGTRRRNVRERFAAPLADVAKESNFEQTLNEREKM